MYCWSNYFASESDAALPEGVLQPCQRSSRLEANDHPRLGHVRHADSVFVVTASDCLQLSCTFRCPSSSSPCEEMGRELMYCCYNLLSGESHAALPESVLQPCQRSSRLESNDHP